MKLPKVFRRLKPFNGNIYYAFQPSSCLSIMRRCSFSRRWFLANMRWISRMAYKHLCRSENNESNIKSLYIYIIYFLWIHMYMISKKNFFVPSLRSFFSFWMPIFSVPHPKKLHLWIRPFLAEQHHRLVGCSSNFPPFSWLQAKQRWPKLFGIQGEKELTYLAAIK